MPLNDIDALHAFIGQLNSSVEMPQNIEKNKCQNESGGIFIIRGFKIREKNTKKKEREKEKKRSEAAWPVEEKYLLFAAG
ncbi:MAG: hypothetical protein JXN65_03005 [Clostridia bacterium]|nr:hypothetical protein [Clostridia bacterium]